METQPLPARAVTEVTVYAADHAGLFSRIAGALAVAGASIVDARIHTLTNGMALDTFWIQDAAGGAFDAPHRLARLYVLIEQALSGRLRLATEIRKASRALLGRRMRAIHVPPRVVIDNHASNTHTVLEVNGRDRPGLLHDVTAAISDQGLQIASAHVTTYGVRAVDVFYVKDVFGLKVENERKLAQLREALLAALASPDDATPNLLPTAAKRGGRRTRPDGLADAGRGPSGSGTPRGMSLPSISRAGHLHLLQPPAPDPPQPRADRADEEAVVRDQHAGCLAAPGSRLPAVPGRRCRRGWSARPAGRNWAPSGAAPAGRAAPSGPATAWRSAGAAFRCRSRRRRAGCGCAGRQGGSVPAMKPCGGAPPRQMRHLLVEIADHDGRADGDAGDRVAGSSRAAQQAHELRLADAVGAQQHDAVVLEDLQRAGAEQRRAVRASRPATSSSASSTLAWVPRLASRMSPVRSRATGPQRLLDGLGALVQLLGLLQQQVAAAVDADVAQLAGVAPQALRLLARRAPASSPARRRRRPAAPRARLNGCA